MSGEYDSRTPDLLLSGIRSESVTVEDLTREFGKRYCPGHGTVPTVYVSHFSRYGFSTGRTRHPVRDVPITGPLRVSLLGTEKTVSKTRLEDKRSVSISLRLSGLTEKAVYV